MRALEWVDDDGIRVIKPLLFIGNTSEEGTIHCVMWQLEDRLMRILRWNHSQRADKAYMSSACVMRLHDRGTVFDRSQTSCTTTQRKLKTQYSSVL